MKKRTALLIIVSLSAFFLMQCQYMKEIIQEMNTWSSASGDDDDRSSSSGSDTKKKRKE